MTCDFKMNLFIYIPTTIFHVDFKICTEIRVWLYQNNLFTSRNL